MFANPSAAWRAARPTIVNDNRGVAILLKGLLATFAIRSDKLLEARLFDVVKLGGGERLLFGPRSSGLLVGGRGSHGRGVVAGEAGYNKPITMFGRRG